MFICVCNERTCVHAHTHSPLMQHSLCLPNCRGPLEECDAHTTVPFWSDCISSPSEGLGLFFAYRLWINEFVLSAGGAQMHTCRRELVVLRRSWIICHKMSVRIECRPSLILASLSSGPFYLRILFILPPASFPPLPLCSLHLLDKCKTQQSTNRGNKCEKVGWLA